MNLWTTYAYQLICVLFPYYLLCHDTVRWASEGASSQ